MGRQSASSRLKKKQRSLNRCAAHHRKLRSTYSFHNVGVGRFEQWVTPWFPGAWSDYCQHTEV